MIRKYNPYKITLLWFVCVILLGIIIGFIADNNATGGEQKLLTYISVSFEIALIGILVINLGTLIFYKNKTRWYSLFFVVGSLVVLYPYFDETFTDQYETHEKTIQVGSDKIDIRIEYYHDGQKPKNMRSESYWKNGRKDSLWITYNKNGGILQKKQYKDGELIESK